MHKLWIYHLRLLRWFFLIVNFDFRFGQEVKVKLGSPSCKYFLRINDLYNSAQIVNLPLAVVEMIFFNSKLWLPVWTGSKGQIGSLFYKYFLTINDLYNGAKIVNLPLAVVEIWFFLILNFDFWFEKEVMVKLGSPSCKYFLTINDLYNGAQIVNLPLAVVEIWFFKILNFDFRFGQEVKVKLGHFCINIFDN